MGTDYVKQSVSGGFDTTATINQNFTDLETALGRVLNVYGDNTTGVNAMQGSLDMNSQQAVNAAYATSNAAYPTLAQVNSLITSGSLISDVTNASIVNTKAALTALDVTSLADNSIAYTKGYATVGDGGHGTYYYDSSSAATDNGGSILDPDSGTGQWLLIADIMNAGQFGAAGDGAADDGAEIQALIDAAETLRVANSTSTMTKVQLLPGKTYLYATGLVIPPKLTVECNYTLLKYSGTGVSITLGDSDSVLSPDCGLINFRMHLTNKASTGVRLRGTRGAVVRGYIEGLATYDNTRTNIGVDIDGVDISSFFNHIEVDCNHIHESFRVTTTGTVQPTAQLFLNCSAGGDQSTDDASIGYNFADTTVTGSGSGTRIIGGNIEDCQIAMYFGQNATDIVADTRIEIASQTGSRVLKYHTTAAGIKVHGTGINLAQIGAVNSGIEGFDTSSDSNEISDANGNSRRGGNATSFSGFNSPIEATNAITQLYASDARTLFINNDGASGVGEFLIQPGNGGGGTGGFLDLYGHAHSTKPMECLLGPSTGGVVRVQNGRNGASMVEAGTVSGQIRVTTSGVEVNDLTPQELTGAGAVNLTSHITHIVTTAADALTLADGAEGQTKFIVMKTDGGAGTLTPTNLGNGSTLTFDDVGDSAHLLFTNAAWHFMGGTATLA